MKSYIETLKAQATTLPDVCKRSESRAPEFTWEPLENQIRRWWVNLPPVMQQRPFQIIEIATQCRGRYRAKPALREVATALRSLGWSEKRDWSTLGRNRRFWVPV